MATNFSRFVRFVSIQSNQQHFQPTLKVQINYIFKVSCKSTSSMSNRQKGKRFMSIRWNRVHKSISGWSNRKYQRGIDCSWVYCTTLVTLLYMHYLMQELIHTFHVQSYFWHCLTSSLLSHPLPQIL